mmetsp:Transcript_13972/g.30338  ORF Transcript_13972/g.30338 Transcript_13972/m.30338 type:complete len:180 (-) Transcript_13972:500-1039(-)
MMLHTSSRKARSCVTVRNVIFLFSFIRSLSHWMAARSKWLVGSSHISTSGSLTNAAANATRFLSPPESMLSGWSSRCLTLNRVETSSALVSTAHPSLASMAAAAFAKASGSEAAWRDARRYSRTAAYTASIPPETLGASELSRQVTPRRASDTVTSEGEGGSCSTNATETSLGHSTCPV